MKREAKERQGERNDLKNNIVANLPQSSKEKRKPQTDEIVAKKIGVSKNTYKGMKQIVSEGTPETCGFLLVCHKNILSKSH